MLERFLVLYGRSRVQMMMTTTMEPEIWRTPRLPGLCDRGFEKKNVRRISAFSVFVCYYHYYSTLYYYDYYYFLFFIFYHYAIYYIHRYSIYNILYTLVLTDVPHKRRTTASWFESESCRKWWIRYDRAADKKKHINRTYIIMNERVRERGASRPINTHQMARDTMNFFFLAPEYNA